VAADTTLVRPAPAPATPDPAAALDPGRSRDALRNRERTGESR
jgi:hypothetical protein